MFFFFFDELGRKNSSSPSFVAFMARGALAFLTPPRLLYSHRLMHALVTITHSCPSIVG